MKNFKSLFLLAVFALLFACKNAPVKPMVQNKLPPAVSKELLQKFRFYGMNYDLVWNRAVHWFTEHNIRIDKMEISSGEISAKYLMKTDATFLNCALPEKLGRKSRPKSGGYGALTVKVSNESQTATRVEVFFFGEAACTSTGQIEADILNYIGKNVSKSN